MKFKKNKLYVDQRYGIVEITELYRPTKPSLFMGDLIGKYTATDGFKYLLFRDNSIVREASDLDIINFISYNSFSIGTYEKDYGKAQERQFCVEEVIYE